MAINFPASPSTNDTFAAGSITYKWDGAKWIGLGVTPADRLVEGSNSLEINAGNDLVWTGGNIIIPEATNTSGKLQLGASQQLSIFQDSANAYLANDDFIISNSAVSEVLARFRNGGAVDLHYDNSKKFETTSTGANITDQLSIGSGSSANSQYGLIAYSNSSSLSNRSAVYARNLNAGGRTFTGDNDTGATTFEVFANGNVNCAGTLSAGTGGSFDNEVYINGSDASTQRYLNFNRPTSGEYRATLRRDAWYLGETVQNIGNVTPDGANITLKMNGDAIFAGNCLFGTTSNGTTVKGIVARSTGEFLCSRTNGPALLVNRLGNDGTLVDFRGQNSSEGSISVSGGTISYNGAHLSRWSQLPGNAERTEILRGSVLSNLDEMCEWGEEDNEQLNRMKVSDVEGDRNVAGVFQGWDDDDETYINDFYCAMTGDFVIRIAQGTTVARGDLLMSAGDGTAKPQDDDIVRSKTVAKVTSTTVSATYADGSYCVPCVLMAC